jgi:dTDP-glucose 4,6-dehydratase
MSKHPKTLLLTGAAGFIGSNVLEYLFNKYPQYRFIVLDALTYAGQMKNIPEGIRHSPRFSFWYGDVRNAKLVDDLVVKSDIVIHFAAETHVTRSIYDNSKFFETDVLGTQAVANAVLAHERTVDRFLHISTCEVYGEGLTKRMNESHPLNPQSPYAAAKAGADRLVYAYHRTYGIPALILRPFNIFGPRQHLEKVTPRFVTSGILGEPLTVHGDGKYSRDFMYVEDMARAIDSLLHAPRSKVIGQVFNIGSGTSVSIVALAKAIMREMKCPLSQLTYIGDRPGQVNNFACDYSKIHKAFGWKPEISFENGIRKTVEWYKNNQDIWESQMWMRHVPVKTAKGKVEMH